MLRENDGRGAMWVGGMAGAQPSGQVASFRKFRKADTASIALAAMLITLSNIPLSLHAAAPGTPMDWNEPEKKSAGTRETRRASQISGARREIATWEALAAQFIEGKRPERDGYIIFSRLDSLYRVLGSNDALTDEDRARQSKVRDVAGELKKKNPDWELMQDRRLSDEIPAQPAEKSGPQSPPKSKFAPKDRRPLKFLNDAKSLVVQFQYRMEFYSLRGSSSVDNQGGAVAILDSQGNALEWGRLPKLSQLTFKRRFRVKHQKGISHVLVCTDPLHSWYRADSREEELELADHPSQSNHSIPWVNSPGEQKDFCGVIDYSGRTIFKFPLPQQATGNLLLPLAVREDGVVAVLAGKTIKQETGDGMVDAIGLFSEVLIWTPSKGLRRVPANPQTANEVELRQQFMLGKL